MKHKEMKVLKQMRQSQLIDYLEEKLEVLHLQAKQLKESNHDLQVSHERNKRLQKKIDELDAKIVERDEQFATLQDDIFEPCPKCGYDWEAPTAEENRAIATLLIELNIK